MKYFLLIILISPLFSIAQLNGKVIGISDGDTFNILTSQSKQIRIRMYGIDCPEHGQAFGEAAKEYLSSLIFGKEVQVTDKGLDRYGRTLGIVICLDSNINELMIRQGYAWHYVHYDRNPTWDEYQENARRLKKGLWADSIPIEPWNWRHSRAN